MNNAINEEVQEIETKLPELVNDGRKLVTVRYISEIKPIDGADNIVCACVDGWEVVVKKDEFKNGDMCLFFEVDSFIRADDPRFSFLLSRGVRKDEKDVERLRVRSIKLRKVLSQGLALPLSSFPEINTMNVDELERLGSGVEQFLDVIKYERPSERNGGCGNRASTASDFPWYIQKTDEPRIQNVFGKYKEQFKEVKFRRSLKLDGSSTTIAYVSDEKYYIEKLANTKKEYNEETGEVSVVVTEEYPFADDMGQVLLCSRNLVLKYTSDNHFWRGVEAIDLPSRIKRYCEEYDQQIALQGETIGPGIQGNPEKLDSPTFYAFRIWDIKNQKFFSDDDFVRTCYILGVPMAPLGEIEQPFLKYEGIKELLASADIRSLNSDIAEGVVYKSIEEVNGSTIHFKVINNKWLMKVED